MIADSTFEKTVFQRSGTSSKPAPAIADAVSWCSDRLRQQDKHRKHRRHAVGGKGMARFPEHCR
jgi:hypothetical protein